MPRRNKKNRQAKKDSNRETKDRTRPSAKTDSSAERDSSTSGNRDKKAFDDVVRYHYTPGPRIDISLDENGALLKEVIKSGSGDFMPYKGSKVVVHYLAFTIDSVVLFDTKDLHEPESFVVGEGTCVKGIEVAVTTMRKGEVAILTSELSYYSGIRYGLGLQAYYSRPGSISPFGPLYPVYFKVELLDWEDADISLMKDGGILKRIIDRGEGTVTPSDGHVVDIYISCEYNKKVVLDKRCVFVLGCGKGWDVPKGVEIALRTFKVKEKSRIILSPELAWGVNENPKFGIPPKQKVTYFVRLNRICKSERIKETSISERVVEAVFLRDRGSDFFNDGCFPLAAVWYKKMIRALEAGVGCLYVTEDGSIHSVPGEISEENKSVFDSLKLIGHLNLAATFLKMQMHNEAKTQCDKALLINPVNEKGLYRRAMAYMGAGYFKEAIKDFKAVLDVNPNNALAENHLKQCKEKVTEETQPDKEVLRDMFL